MGEEEQQRKLREQEKEEVFAALRKAVEKEKEEADRKAAEEEAARKVVEAEAAAALLKAEAEAGVALLKASEEAAAQKRIEEKRAQREATEDIEMEKMDENCIETFLDTVWNEKIRTPLKGTILYTKHIRPNRPAGTSVDVKDSTFRNLGNFLKFLEDEGLIRLKPGLTDPLVTEICSGACRDYKYKPQSKPSAIKDASSATAGYPVPVTAPYPASAAARSWQ